MANPLIKLPKDTSSEIFFDANRLVVDFRHKDAKKKSAAGVKVLRVVVQCYGFVIEDRFFQAGTAITFGSSKNNLIQIGLKDLPEGHPLFEYGLDGTITLSINKSFTGVIQTEDRLKTFADLIGTKPTQTLSLTKGSKGCIEQGTLLFYFEEIADPEKVPPVAIFKNFADPQFKRWFLVSLILHLLLLLLIRLLGPLANEEVKLEDLAPQFQKIIVQPQDIKPYVPLKALGTTNVTRGSIGREGEGERAGGTEGMRGRGVKGAGSRVTTKDIKKTGVLDVFARSGKGSALDQLLGGGSGVPGDVDKAFNRAARYGLPGEHELREGKGLQGAGKGGGGRTESIGQGLGTKGKGGGRTGTGYADFGTGKSNTAVSASIDSEDVYIMGNLPREVIAKIMEDNMGQIRYCYSKQVQIQPELRGKITTNFVIGLEGRVTSARVSKSSMGSAPVENCIINVIKRIQFPKPGGGIVEVNSFPFSFHVAG